MLYALPTLRFDEVGDRSAARASLSAWKRRVKEIVAEVSERVDYAHVDEAVKDFYRPLRVAGTPNMKHGGAVTARAETPLLRREAPELLDYLRNLADEPIMPPEGKQAPSKRRSNPTGRSVSTLFEGYPWPPAKPGPWVTGDGVEVAPIPPFSLAYYVQCLKASRNEFLTLLRGDLAGWPDASQAQLRLADVLVRLGLSSAARATSCARPAA